MTGLIWKVRHFLKHGTWKQNIEYVMHCRSYFSFLSLVMTCQVSKDTVPRMNVLPVSAGGKAGILTAVFLLKFATCSCVHTTKAIENHH